MQLEAATHTPGPWRAMAGVEDESRWGVVTAHGGFLVAVIENGAPGDTLRTEGANAALIAAAPDMREILRAIKEECDLAAAGGTPLDPAAISAVCDSIVAKAEGR